MLYWTVIVPSVPPEFATEWHPDRRALAPPSKDPFDPLSRGCFKSEADAIRWAREHLNGTPYSLKQYDDGEP
jgi:hypothetical protein